MDDETFVPDDVVDATFDASRVLLTVVARSMDAALEKVTLQQFRILVILAEQGALRMGALAERTGVSPSTLTRTVERMIVGNWVEREPSTTSRREIFVRATPAAVALVDDVMRQRRDALRAILADVSPTRRDQVRRALGAFAAAAGDMTPSSERWPVV